MLRYLAVLALGNAIHTASRTASLRLRGGADDAATRSHWQFEGRVSTRKALAAYLTSEVGAAHGTSFASIPSKGIEAWDAVPGIGKVQMLLFAGLIELHDELFFSRRGDHYLRGGTPGKNMVPGLYDPLGLNAKKTDDELARGRDVEIKNGRLAMIGFIGLWAQANISGAIPVMGDC